MRLATGQSARSFVLDGLRGVGKTVVLNEADIVAREHGCVSSGVLECNEDDDLPLLMARLSHRALRRLSTGRRVGAAVKRALGVLRAFTFAMDEHGAWRFNIDVKAVTGVADSGDAEAGIVELLAEVAAAAAQHGSGAAFLLDELQFLGKRSLATLAAAMHGVSQQNSPVLLVAAGRPQLPLMLKSAKPYTERLLDYRTIGGLPRATAATALTVPAQRARATFEQDALDLILDRADGYPYFLQQWSETVWREAEGPPSRSAMRKPPKSSSTTNWTVASSETCTKGPPRLSGSTWQRWPISVTADTARARSPVAWGWLRRSCRSTARASSRRV
jgi:AAA ATPase domain